jgi:hypothetical protein
VGVVVDMIGGEHLVSPSAVSRVGGHSACSWCCCCVPWHCFLLFDKKKPLTRRGRFSGGDVEQIGR